MGPIPRTAGYGAHDLTTDRAEVSDAGFSAHSGDCGLVSGFCRMFVGIEIWGILGRLVWLSSFSFGWLDGC